MNARSNCEVTIPSDICQPSVASVLHYARDGEVPMITQTENKHDDLTLRARAEFREMPGMVLTTGQATRLWQLSPARSEELLSELVQSGFLVRRDGQRYRLPSSVLFRHLRINSIAPSKPQRAGPGGPALFRFYRRPPRCRVDLPLAPRADAERADIH